MKTIKLSLLLTTVIASAMLSGCDQRVGKNSTIYRESFIEEYMDVNSLNIISDNIGGIIVECAGDLHLVGDTEYTELVEYYGDTEFKRKEAPGSHITAVSQEITHIDIVSSAEFNDYPAGVSLRDIVDVRLFTLWPYIQSGCSDGIPQYTEVKQGLSNITLEDMMLISGGRI